MNADKAELESILEEVRQLQEKIRALDVRPNWESEVKADMLRAINILDVSVSDFIVSLEIDSKDIDEETDLIISIEKDLGRHDEAELI